MGNIELIKGDITKIDAGAVVNAANTSLLGGGGVDGAIHRTGGEAILNDCRNIIARQGGCKTGEAVITTGGNLPAKYVIHTVGPVYGNGSRGEDEQLRSAYINSLKLAVENDVKTVAFPNISTGIYRFPKDKAAVIAIKAVNGFLTENTAIEKVIFVCYDEENYKIYDDLLKH